MKAGKERQRSHRSARAPPASTVASASLRQLAAMRSAIRRAAPGCPMRARPVAPIRRRSCGSSKSAAHALDRGVRLGGENGQGVAEQTALPLGDTNPRCASRARRRRRQPARPPRRPPRWRCRPGRKRARAPQQRPDRTAPRTHANAAFAASRANGMRSVGAIVGHVPTRMLRRRRKPLRVQPRRIESTAPSARSSPAKRRVTREQKRGIGVRALAASRKQRERRAKPSHGSARAAGSPARQTNRR